MIGALLSIVATVAFFIPAIAHDELTPKQQVDRVVWQIGDPATVTIGEHVKLARKAGDMIPVGYICKDRGVVERVAKLYEAGKVQEGNVTFYTAIKIRACFPVPRLQAQIVRILPRVYVIGGVKGQIYEIRLGKVTGWILYQI